MIPREQGSDTSRVEIRGGAHDGSTGMIVHQWSDGKSQIVQVALDAGGTVDLQLTPGVTPREAARNDTVTLRTLGS